jgi:hypothetical protein
VFLAAFERGLSRGHRILTVFDPQISAEFDFVGPDRGGNFVT